MIKVLRIFNIKRKNILDLSKIETGKIKLNEKTIHEIRCDNKEDILQDLIDEIILSYNSEKLSLYKKLIKFKN